MEIFLLYSVTQQWHANTTVFYIHHSGVSISPQAHRPTGPRWVISPPCHEHQWRREGRQSTAQLWSKKSWWHPVLRQRVLWAVSITHDLQYSGFYFKRSDSLLGDDEVAMPEYRKWASLWRLWPDMFFFFFSPQLEAIVSHSYHGSLSSVEIYLSEDNWPLNPHLTTVKMPPQE